MTLDLLTEVCQDLSSVREELSAVKQKQVEFCREPEGPEFQFYTKEKSQLQIQEAKLLDQRLHLWSLKHVVCEDLSGEHESEALPSFDWALCVPMLLLLTLLMSAFRMTKTVRMISI